MRRPPAPARARRGGPFTFTSICLGFASSRLGIVTVQGHTRRPLFESLTNRDSVRYYNTGLVEPCLFSTGRVVGGKDRESHGLRMLEIGDGRITSVRWSKGKRERQGATYRRSETHATTIRGLLDRVALFAPGQSEERSGEGQA